MVLLLRGGDGRGKGEGIRGKGRGEGNRRGGEGRGSCAPLSQIPGSAPGCYLDETISLSLAEVSTLSQLSTFFRK